MICRVCSITTALLYAEISKQSTQGYNEVQKIFRYKNTACSTLFLLQTVPCLALMEITSKNYQRILEFKLSNHAGRLSPSDTDIISQSPKNDKGENSDYYTDKKKVDRLQQPYQRAFTPEEIQKIVTAYQSGKASYELGAEFNCSKTTIVKLLKQQGVPLRKSGRTRAKVDDKKVIRMYKEMHTIKEISKNLNVDTQVISRCLKENGVKLRSRWDYPEK